MSKSDQTVSLWIISRLVNPPEKIENFGVAHQKSHGPGQNITNFNTKIRRNPTQTIHQKTTTTVGKSSGFMD